jgi:transposase-like protein
MPWREVSAVTLRTEFVLLASQEGANVRALCRRFGISPATAYKWLARYRYAGPTELEDRSRRPHHSPRLTSAEVEAKVLAVRQPHPAWGGRELAAVLDRQDPPVLVPQHDHRDPRRNGRLSGSPRVRHAWQRFERETPNQLWQMDFKGHVSLS